MFEIVGGSFTGVTMRTKVSLAVATPSLTMTVIVAVPAWFVAGSIAMVRLTSVPPNTMFPLGTSVGLEDEALTTRLVTGVSISPTVNAIGPVDVSSGVLRLRMSEIVGGSFTALTFRTK